MSPEQIVDIYTLSAYRFERANQELITTKLLIKSNSYLAANNRAYYAIFHAIRSVLALDNVDYKKHSAVIGHFNKNYIATNIFDKKYGEIIKNTFKIRQSSDYEDFYVIDKNKTEELVINAESFLQEVKKYLEAKQVILNY